MDDGTIQLEEPARAETGSVRQPSLFIPHGGGPCFFMDDPHDLWTALAAFLRALPASLPACPKAILIVSGHWETRGGFALTGSARPPLIYDYYGFPPHTYELRYPAPGSPDVAAEATALLHAAGFAAAIDPARGLDHGVFVPLKVAFPNADVPIVQMSLDHTLDPARHLAAGRALAALRDQGVLIVGSGMSFHNMRAYGDPRALPGSVQFDTWLAEAVAGAGPARDAALTRWEAAPAARFAHPRAEHLLPLMVAAGAAEGAGRRTFNGAVMGTMISGFRFD